VGAPSDVLSLSILLHDDGHTIIETAYFVTPSTGDDSLTAISAITLQEANLREDPPSDRVKSPPADQRERVTYRENTFTGKLN